MGRAPHRQLAADELSALAHTVHAEVSFTPTLAQDFRVDALAVVPHAEPESTLIVSKLDFDLLRRRVPEGIVQRFARDAEDFVTHDRMQCPRRALNLDL